jgi:hypothetical protein
LEIIVVTEKPKPGDLMALPGDLCDQARAKWAGQDTARSEVGRTDCDINFIEQINVTSWGLAGPESVVGLSSQTSRNSSMSAFERNQSGLDQETDA